MRLYENIQNDDEEIAVNNRLIGFYLPDKTIPNERKIENKKFQLRKVCQKTSTYKIWCCVFSQTRNLAKKM